MRLEYQFQYFLLIGFGYLPRSEQLLKHQEEVIRRHKLAPTSGPSRAHLQALGNSSEVKGVQIPRKLTGSCEQFVRGDT